VTSWGLALLAAYVALGLSSLRRGLAVRTAVYVTVLTLLVVRVVAW
jgi:hypothetical protein